MTTGHRTLFLCPFTLSTACNGANDSQRERHCDLNRALREDTWCVQKLSELWNPMMTIFTVLYSTSPILQTLNIQPFSYEKFCIFQYNNDSINCNVKS